MNTIRIELCQEDRDRLDKILEALTVRPDCQKCTQNVADYVARKLGQVPNEQTGAAVVEPQATEDTAPVEEPAAVAETAAAEPEPTVSQAGVQKKVVELSAAGQKDAVRQIVQAYAPRVSAIPEDKLVEVWQKLTALEG